MNIRPFDGYEKYVSSEGDEVDMSTANVTVEFFKEFSEIYMKPNLTIENIADMENIAMFLAKQSSSECGSDFCQANFLDYLMQVKWKR